jgi:TatD DNase family protein
MDHGRLAYSYQGRVYLNITNRCPVSCEFCPKGEWRLVYRGLPLALEEEPSAEEVAAAGAREAAALGAKEAVFCGFGEPTERLDALLSAAALLKTSRPRLRLRLNTVGLGSLTAGRDISRPLSTWLDGVSVSLNTADAAQWRALHRPRRGLAEQGFSAVCDFIRRCARAGLETTATAVDQPGVDLVAVESLARSLGARFRLRPLLTGADAAA